MRAEAQTVLRRLVSHFIWNGSGARGYRTLVHTNFIYLIIDIILWRNKESNLKATAKLSLFQGNDYKASDACKIYLIATTCFLFILRFTYISLYVGLKNVILMNFMKALTGVGSESVDLSTPILTILLRFVLPI